MPFRARDVGTTFSPGAYAPGYSLSPPSGARRITPVFARVPVIGREDGLVWHCLAQAVWSWATPCELVPAREWIEPTAKPGFVGKPVRRPSKAVGEPAFSRLDGLGRPSYDRQHCFRRSRATLSVTGTDGPHPACPDGTDVWPLPANAPARVGARQTLHADKLRGGDRRMAWVCRGQTDAPRRQAAWGRSADGLGV